MNASHRSPLKRVKKSVDWNNAKEQICNQCLIRHLWFTWESSGIFHTSSAVASSRFLAGVDITNISMQLALPYNEPDYLTCNPTSRHGTIYNFTWSRPTVEPVWISTLNHRDDNVDNFYRTCQELCPAGFALLYFVLLNVLHIDSISSIQYQKLGLMQKTIHWPKTTTFLYSSHAYVFANHMENKRLNTTYRTTGYSYMHPVQSSYRPHYKGSRGTEIKTFKMGVQLRGSIVTIYGFI